MGGHAHRADGPRRRRTRACGRVWSRPSRQGPRSGCTGATPPPPIRTGFARRRKRSRSWRGRSRATATTTCA
jgi:hypothetical protein